METTIINDTIAYIEKNNKSKNAYHNTNHLKDVYNNVKNICSDYNLLVRTKELLFIAALFHDYKHSGGKLSDAENIKLAIKGFKKYAKLRNDYFTEEDVLFICKLIEATQYPHIDIEENIFTDIIRDADLLSSVDVNYLDVMRNLSKELKITFLEFIPMQLKFYEKLNFKTKFAKALKEDRLHFNIKHLGTILNWNNVLSKEYDRYNGQQETFNN